MNTRRINESSATLSQTKETASQAFAQSTQNSEAIARNQRDIQSLRADFEEMAKKVDGAYAESAAFAGLVSPYGVGKLSVTAALGYHGQAQAIAIGVGERFSENLTAKLGGAYDTATQSSTAYVGVGYEF